MDDIWRCYDTMLFVLYYNIRSSTVESLDKTSEILKIVTKVFILLFKFELYQK